MATKHGVDVRLRPTNPHSVPRLDAGAHPKLSSMPMKTLDEIDLWLLPTATTDDLGTVGMYRPVMPSRPTGMSDELWKKIEDRAAFRAKEFANSNEYFQPGGPPWSQDAYVQDGIVRNRQTGRPYAGDNDIYDVRLPDGSYPDPKIVKRFMDDLYQRGAGVEHGGVMDWHPLDPGFDIEKFEDLVDAHSKTKRSGTPGKPLQQIHADGRKPTTSYADD
jgi:hypothetical protein